jgi:hypothetical protein
MADVAASRADSLFRHDDASWVESKHPRDADGKFTAGSAGHGAKSYAATLKPGAKGSAAGLIKHMVEAGTYGKSDIAIAALESYGVKPASVPWYLNDIKKKTGKEAPLHSKPSSEKAQAVAPAEAPKAAEPTGMPDAAKKLAHKLAIIGVPMAVMSDLKPVFEHWEKLTAENKPKVEGKLEEILDALDSAYEKGKAHNLKKIEPIFGSGLSVNAVNKALGDLKAKHGVTSSTAYAPTTLAEKKVYEAAKSAPHYRQDHVNYFEDASGKEVKATLKTDTKKIPGDHYALVTSSYGKDKDNGDQSSVSLAMDSYATEQNKARTPEQEIAIAGYQDGDYAPINKALNGQQEASTLVKDGIEHLRAVMAKSYVPADTPVFRGLQASLKDLTGFDDPEHAVGRCFVHANFASVSRSPNVSANFGKNSMLKFVIPAGANGLVMKHGQAHGEREIVLPDNAVFRVMKVEQNASVMGNTIKNLIHVMYLGTKDKDV